MTIMLIPSGPITARSNRNELFLGIVLFNFPHCLKVDSILGFSILCSHTVAKAIIAPPQMTTMFAAFPARVWQMLASILWKLVSKSLWKVKMTKTSSLCPLFLLNSMLSAMYWSLTVFAVLELHPEEVLN